MILFFPFFATGLSVIREMSGFGCFPGTHIVSKKVTTVSSPRDRKRCWLAKACFTTDLIRLLGFIALPNYLLAQEAVRMSLAGESAADLRRNLTLSMDHSTMRLGSTLWQFSAGLALEVNDNIRFASTDPDADLIIEPRIQTRMAWPVSQNNSANLSFNGGFSAYATHSEFDRFFMGPGSELSFDVYLGDFWINLHNRLSVTESAYQDPTVVGTANYSQLQNVAGLSITWDLNKILLTLGYDHANYITLSGGGAPDGASDVFSCSASYQLDSTTQLGLQAGGGFLSYSDSNAGGTPATDWNLGGLAQIHLLEYVSIRANAGYTVYAPLAGRAAETFTGFYGQLGLQHRINKYLDYYVSGGRSINFGFYAGTIDLYSAVLTARWHLFQKLSVSIGLLFEHGSQALVGEETFQRFGPNVSLERSITSRLSGVLRYQFYNRQSNAAGLDYAINIVTATVVYRL